jgi:hypothetical protein
VQALLCSGCGAPVPRSGFSKNQASKPAATRKCKRCVDIGGGAESPTAAEPVDGAAKAAKARKPKLDKRPGLHDIVATRKVFDQHCLDVLVPFVLVQINGKQTEASLRAHVRKHIEASGIKFVLKGLETKYGAAAATSNLRAELTAVAAKLHRFGGTVERMELDNLMAQLGVHVTKLKPAMREAITQSAAVAGGRFGLTKFFEALFSAVDQPSPQKASKPSSPRSPQKPTGQAAGPQTGGPQKRGARKKNK